MVSHQKPNAAVSGARSASARLRGSASFFLPRRQQSSGLSHSTPFATNNDLAAGLAKKAMNVVAVWGDSAPLIGAAA